MSEELDRFSLILGPGEKIEEPKPPKKKKKKTKARLTNGNPRDLEGGPKKRKGRPKKIKGTSGDDSAERKRYKIKNRGPGTISIQIPSDTGGVGKVNLSKADELVVSLRPQDLQRSDIPALVAQGYVTIEEEKPPPKEGQFVYLLPDGKCTTEVPTGKNDTVVRYGYIVSSNAIRSESAQFVTMRMDVDGFETDVMTDGVVQEGDVMVMLRGGEMEMYSTGGERLDPNGAVGSNGPYGLGNTEEEQQENEVESLFDLMDEY